MLTNAISQSLMIFVSATQFHVYFWWPTACLTQCHNSVLNVKALVGAFNQEKALEGAFSVIVKTDGLFAALVSSLRLSGSRLH